MWNIESTNFLYTHAGRLAMLSRYLHNALAYLFLSTLLLGMAITPPPTTADESPFMRQVLENIERLGSEDPAEQIEGIEKLGYMRAYSAEFSLLAMLGDESSDVRREAAMSLGWCGGRETITPLIEAMEDENWSVRQAAWISLTNLTGLEFPFEGLASQDIRNGQVEVWQAWAASIPEGRPPSEVLALLENAPQSISGQTASASTTYKGPPEVLIDGRTDGDYWQTKLVDPPQWVEIDLGRTKEIQRVVVHQYSDAFVMTGYELSVSLDNETYEVIETVETVENQRTPVRLTIDFPARPVRYVKITSFGSVNPTYPTTFYEIEALTAEGIKSQRLAAVDSASWRLERGVRALGVFGGEGATEAVLNTLGENPTTSGDYRQMVIAAIRSLGRLRTKTAYNRLIGLLDDPMWARYAADALGDFGSPYAVEHLLRVYPRYAKLINGVNPPDVPRDDKMGFPSEDRMLETPYRIEYALCRLPIDRAEDLAALRELAPRIMSNMPTDHDTFFLYEPEVGHELAMYLMPLTGRKEEARQYLMQTLGVQDRLTWADFESGNIDPSIMLTSMQAAAEPVWSPYDAQRISAWLPALCTSSEDVPTLLWLLGHENGWVRLNASKALAWIGDQRAIPSILQCLQNAPAEADFGYSGTFKFEEYDDPAPRWREGPIRALGLLGAEEATGLLISILNDSRSVAEIRLAAAQALGDIGTQDAAEALRIASVAHPFLVVRQKSRDAYRNLGGRISENEYDDIRDGYAADFAHERPLNSTPIDSLSNATTLPSDTFDKVVFIQGSNSIPNTIGTVEQADRWRSDYAVTDSGPCYRPGRNLYVLSPAGPDGIVEPLTPFEDGYVADLELSWDGRHAIFSHREQDNPWWHVWRINIDGTGLEQLTFGPFHDVGATYMPDGRILFTSSRSGIRDEYHGYPCTVLHIMDPDGRDIHSIAQNIGRDNEPSILADGRIVFSRLEVFYSRNKTELTLHAMNPDGSRDVVLYGPERRPFWRSLDHGPRSPADGQEAPLTHRVLRVTQPQAMPDGRNIVLSTQAGMTMVGVANRFEEDNFMSDFRERSYTTPYPLPDGRLLCASSLKVASREEVDLALYVYDFESQELELLYNDPEKAEFEARPVLSRPVPPIRPETVRPSEYSGRFVCMSVYSSQELEVPVRGRYVRLIEGTPAPARHSTHTNVYEVWQNHGGTFARVLGTYPLAPDGSFHAEAPADRLLQFQVLDSDRRVVGNQKTWIYPRPGEIRSCTGCHENPGTTTRGNNPLAAHEQPADFLPNGREFTYRAKAWFKGSLPGEIEERTRSARSVNVMGR
jgi:HEAT repeat protein